MKNNFIIIGLIKSGGRIDDYNNTNSFKEKMETSTQNEKLKIYSFDNKEIMVGFANFQDAEKYARENGGNLVEVAFEDGNDNPKITNAANLIEQRKHFAVKAGKEYRFLHSADPEFRNFADELQQYKSNELDRNSPEEKFITNAEIEISEDPIIVLKNDQFESITSRERSKYLKHAKVYEIGVEKNKTKSL